MTRSGPRLVPGTAPAPEEWAPLPGPANENVRWKTACAATAPVKTCRKERCRSARTQKPAPARTATATRAYGFGTPPPPTRCPARASIVQHTARRPPRPMRRRPRPGWLTVGLPPWATGDPGCPSVTEPRCPRHTAPWRTFRARVSWLLPSTRRSGLPTESSVPGDQLQAPGGVTAGETATAAMSPASRTRTSPQTQRR